MKTNGQIGLGMVTGTVIGTGNGMEIGHVQRMVVERGIVNGNVIWSVNWISEHVSFPSNTPIRLLDSIDVPTQTSCELELRLVT